MRIIGSIGLVAAIAMGSIFITAACRSWGWDVPGWGWAGLSFAYGIALGMTSGLEVDRK